MTTLHILIRSKANILKTSVFILTLMAALALFIPALAQSANPPTSEPLVLTSQQGQYALGRYMDILEDPSGKLTIEDVASPEFATRFVRSQADAPGYGYTNSAYWVRFHVRNEAPDIVSWLVEVDFPNMFFVDLYYPASAGGQGFVQKQSGVMRPVSERELKYFRMVFPLPLEYQKDTVAYMRFQSSAFMTLGTTLWAPELFINRRLVETLLLGIFYGALLIMLFYNLFLVYTLRDWSYVLFTLFIFFATLGQSAYDGLLETYVWPAANVLKKFTLIGSIDVYMILLLLFVIPFFELRRKMQLLRTILFFFIGVWLAHMALLVFTTYHTGILLVSYFSPITNVLVMLISLVFIIRGFKPSRYFLLSCFGFFFGDTIIFLSHLGVIFNSFLIEQSSRIGLIWIDLVGSVLGIGPGRPDPPAQSRY